MDHSKRKNELEGKSGDEALKVKLLHGALANRPAPVRNTQPTEGELSRAIPAHTGVQTKPSLRTAGGREPQPEVPEDSPSQGPVKVRKVGAREAAERVLGKIKTISSTLNLQAHNSDLEDIHSSYRKVEPIDVAQELRKRWRTTGLESHMNFSSSLQQVENLVDDFMDPSVIPGDDFFEEEEQRILKETRETFGLHSQLMAKCRCGARHDVAVEAMRGEERITARRDMVVGLAGIMSSLIAGVRVLEQQVVERDQRITTLARSNSMLTTKFEDLQRRAQSGALGGVDSADLNLNSASADATEIQARQLEREAKLMNGLKREMKANSRRSGNDKVRLDIQTVVATEFKNDKTMDEEDRKADARWVKVFMARNRRIQALARYNRRLEKSGLEDVDFDAVVAVVPTTEVGIQTIPEEDVFGSPAWKAKYDNVKSVKRQKAQTADRKHGTTEVINRKLNMGVELASTGFLEPELVPHPIKASVENLLGVTKELMTSVDSARVNTVVDVTPFVEDARSSKAMNHCYLWQTQLEEDVRDGTENIRAALTKLRISLTECIQKAVSEAVAEAGSAGGGPTFDAMATPSEGSLQTGGAGSLVGSLNTPTGKQGKGKNKSVSAPDTTVLATPQGVKRLQTSMKGFCSWVRDRFGKEVPEPIDLGIPTDTVNELARKMTVAMVMVDESVPKIEQATSETQVDPVEFEDKGHQTNAMPFIPAPGWLQEITLKGLLDQFDATSDLLKETMKGVRDKHFIGYDKEVLDELYEGDQATQLRAAAIKQVETDVSEQIEYGKNQYRRKLAREEGEDVSDTDSEDGPPEAHGGWFQPAMQQSLQVLLRWITEFKNGLSVIQYRRQSTLSPPPGSATPYQAMSPAASQRGSPALAASGHRQAGPDGQYSHPALAPTPYQSGINLRSPDSNHLSAANNNNQSKGTASLTSPFNNSLASPVSLKIPDTAVLPPADNLVPDLGRTPDRQDSEEDFDPLGATKAGTDDAAKRGSMNDSLELPLKEILEEKERKRKDEEEDESQTLKAKSPSKLKGGKAGAGGSKKNLGASLSVNHPKSLDVSTRSTLSEAPDVRRNATKSPNPELAARNEAIVLEVNLCTGATKALVMLIISRSAQTGIPLPVEVFNQVDKDGKDVATINDTVTQLKKLSTWTRMVKDAMAKWVPKAAAPPSPPTATSNLDLILSQINANSSTDVKTTTAVSTAATQAPGSQSTTPASAKIVLDTAVAPFLESLASTPGNASALTPPVLPVVASTTPTSTLLPDPVVPRADGTSNQQHAGKLTPPPVIRSRNNSVFADTVTPHLPAPKVEDAYPELVSELEESLKDAAHKERLLSAAQTKVAALLEDNAELTRQLELATQTGAAGALKRLKEKKSQSESHAASSETPQASASSSYRSPLSPASSPGKVPSPTKQTQPKRIPSAKRGGTKGTSKPEPPSPDNSPQQPRHASRLDDTPIRSPFQVLAGEGKPQRKKVEAIRVTEETPTQEAETADSVVKKPLAKFNSLPAVGPRASSTPPSAGGSHDQWGSALKSFSPPPLPSLGGSQSTERILQDDQGLGGVPALFEFSVVDHPEQDGGLRQGTLNHPPGAAQSELVQVATVDSERRPSTDAPDMGSIPKASSFRQPAGSRPRRQSAADSTILPLDADPVPVRIPTVGVTEPHDHVGGKAGVGANTGVGTPSKERQQRMTREHARDLHELYVARSAPLPAPATQIQPLQAALNLLPTELPSVLLTDLEPLHLGMPPTPSPGIDALLRELSEEEIAEIVMTLVGQPIMRLHTAVMELLREILKRIKLQGVVVTDPLDAVPEGLQPHPTEVLGKDIMLVEAAAGLLRRDSSAALQKIRSTFEVIQLNIQRKRIEQLEAERTKQLAVRNAARSQAPGNQTRSEVDFFIKQRRRIEEQIQERTAHRDRVKAQQIQDFKEFRLPTRQAMAVGVMHIQAPVAQAATMKKGDVVQAQADATQEDAMYLRLFMRRVDRWIDSRQKKRITQSRLEMAQQFYGSNSSRPPTQQRESSTPPPMTQASKAVIGRVTTPGGRGIQTPPPGAAGNAPAIVKALRPRFDKKRAGGPPLPGMTNPKVDRSQLMQRLTSTLNGGALPPK